MPRVLVALTAWLLLAACAPQERAYLVTDAPVAASLGGEKALAAMLRGAATARGMAGVLVVTPVDGDISDGMQTAASDPRSRLVICLSSVPTDLGPWAKEPGVLLAGYGGEGATTGANILHLVPGRAEAFREAGRKLGARVAAEGDPDTARVGILAVSPTGSAVEEIRSFREGLAESLGTPPLYRESRSLTDKSAATRAIREMREEGARYFLLKTYALTATCLEAIEQEGDYAVVEDCGVSGACGEAVILSIETDWAATLGEVLSAARDGAWSRATLPESWRLREE